ncbi:hypothetical protein, conserved, partial [Eimeria necatrix]
MPKKKPKRKVPQPKVDLQKLQEDARRQHIEESTALVLQHADRPQKELLGQWIEEATKIKKQEALQGLEREIGKHEGLVETQRYGLVPKESGREAWDYEFRIREEDAALAYEENFHQSSDLSLFQNRAVELQHQLQSRAAAAAQTLKGGLEKAAQSHAAATE